MTGDVQAGSDMRGMRAAFLVTSHADIDQLRRLVRLLLTSDSSISVYISHDIAGEPGVENLAGPRCRVIRHRGGRGDFTQMERVLSLLRMLELDGGADYTTVLSGADYPSRPISEYLDALSNSGDGFLHHFPALDERASDWSVQESRQRYLFRWRSLWRVSPDRRRRWHWLHALNYVQPLLRVNISYGTFRMGLRRGHIPAGLECWGGSTWWSLSRRAVQYLLEITESRPDVVTWGRESLVSDEAFCQSILVSSGIFCFTNDNARYIDFQGDGFGHPKVLALEDLSRIIHSGSYFVRKVDSRGSATLLDALDLRVHGEEGQPRNSPS